MPPDKHSITRVTRLHRSPFPESLFLTRGERERKITRWACRKLYFRLLPLPILGNRSGSNLKDVTPIPPPRRRKRNKGRPLPPKPDEVGTENSSNVDRTETGNEPLYSSVRSPKSSGDEQEAEEKARPYEDCEGKRTKEIYEHKASMRSKFTAIRYSARIFTLAATRQTVENL